MPGKITMENVERTFGSVEVPEANKDLINEITRIYTETAKGVIANVPDCAHRSAALRDLLVSKWACVDAIAKGGEV